MNSLCNHPDPFDSDLHRTWKADRALRQRVPLDQTWRGCLGLAVLLDRPDDTQAHGDLALVQNEQLTWVALRDVPIGHFPGSALMNRRDVNYANTTIASLRHGLPAIDFSGGDLRGAVDFKRMPMVPHLRQTGPKPWHQEKIGLLPGTLDARDQRMFGVLNALSAAMTHFAYGAIDNEKRHCRHAWATLRPADIKPFRASDSVQWMPRPYLAFDIKRAEQLYWAATNSHIDEWIWPCPFCRQVFAGAALGRCKRAGILVLEGGDLVATCLACGKRCRWLMEDGRPWPAQRRFGFAFREGFCRALAGGLPLRAIGPEVYCGVVENEDSAHGGPDLVAHELKSQLDGKWRIVHLPRTAQITVGAGRALEPADVWAHALPAAPTRLRHQTHHQRWDSLAELCGGPSWVGLCQQLWFNHEMVRLACDPQRVLLPAELMTWAVREITPEALWWDTMPMLRYYGWEQQAAVFPPIRLRRWDGLQREMPGDVLLDASIADPRFSANGRRERAGRNRWKNSSSQRLVHGSLVAA